MFGIDCCDVKMKSGHYLKFSTNIFMIESKKSLFVIKFYLGHSSFSLSSFKGNLRSAIDMLDKFRISLLKVAGIMDNWLKDNYIRGSYSRGYRIKQQKKSQKDAVYFQLEDDHDAIIAKREKVLKKVQVQTGVKNYISFLIFTLNRGD